MPGGMILARTEAMDRPEWLALRRRGIGGSDAAKVLGLSKWGGPLTVFLDKTGQLPMEDDDPSEAAYWGTTLEDVVAREFSKRTGLRVQRRNAMFHHPDHSWMIANVDRVIVGRNRGLECKTASAFLAEEWENAGVPTPYYWQCQHYMAVMGWEACYIAALIGGQRFVSREIPRDDEGIRSLVEAERRLWEDHILTGTPPSPQSCDDMAALYPSQEGEDLLSPTEEDLSLAERLSWVRGAIKPLEEEKDRIEGLLKGRIGERAGIDGVATWKQSAAKAEIDWESLALSLNPTREQVEAHTRLKEGKRRFLFKHKGSAEALDF